uniref:Uncharacterized protein n=1 Tax=Anguilla anguilla TaxID=7936 RepID=A0A0E9T0U7_ANGAN
MTSQWFIVFFLFHKTNHLSSSMPLLPE